MYMYMYLHNLNIPISYHNFFLVTKYIFHFFSFVFLDEEIAKKDPKYVLKSVNNEAKSILKELDATYTPDVRKLSIHYRNIPSKGSFNS